MINNHRPVVYNAVSVLVRPWHMPHERVGKRVKLDLVGQGNPRLCMKIRIMERAVVVRGGVLADDMPVLGCKGERARMVILCRACGYIEQQHSCRDE